MLVMTQAHALCAPCPPRADLRGHQDGGGMESPSSRAEMLRLQDPNLPQSSTCAGGREGGPPGKLSTLMPTLQDLLAARRPTSTSGGTCSSEEGLVGIPSAHVGASPSSLLLETRGGWGGVDLYGTPRRPGGGQGETPETQGLAKIRLIFAILQISLHKCHLPTKALLTT